jgi:hypothetical protein
MNIISRMSLVGMLAFAALSASAAPGNTAVGGKSRFDVTGTWAVTTAGGPGPATNMVFVLKQDGDKLTGTVSTNGAPPVEISEARVLRTTIYFEVAMTMPAMPAMPPGGGAPGQRGPGGGPGMGGGGMGGPPGMGGMGGMRGPMVTKYTGSLSGDELKLTSQMKMQARDGDAPTGAGMPKTNLVAKRQQ